MHEVSCAFLRILLGIWIFAVFVSRKRPKGFGQKGWAVFTYLQSRTGLHDENVVGNGLIIGGLIVLRP